MQSHTAGAMSNTLVSDAMVVTAAVVPSRQSPSDAHAACAHSVLQQYDDRAALAPGRRSRRNEAIFGVNVVDDRDTLYQATMLAG